MPFTIEAMRELYEQHGDNLVMFDAEGDGPYSANPSDYWQAGAGYTFPGILAVRIPETFAEVQLPENVETS